MGLFIITLILVLLGVNANYQGLRAAAHALISWFGPDMFGIFGTATSWDYTGLIISVAQFLFDIITTLWEKIIVQLIQGFFAWLRVGFNLVTNFVPGVLPIKIDLFLFSAFMGFGSLVAPGCVFG